MSAPAPDRDPVAIAIETLLLEMQFKGVGSVYKQSVADTVVLAFDDVRAEGKTLDIALVRLASAMMDSEKYTAFLIEALKPARSAEA